MVLYDAVRDGLQFPRLGRRAGDGEIAPEALQVVAYVGISGVEDRSAVDNKAIAVDFGRQGGRRRCPQTIGVLLQGRHRTLEHEVDLLRVGRAEAKGYGIVRVDLG